MKYKVCYTCKEEFEQSFFNKRSQSKDGLQSSCRSCKSVSTSKWKKENRDRNYALNSAWAKRNKDKINENSRRFYRNNVDSELARSAEKRFLRSKTKISLTPEQKEQIKEFYWLAKDLQAVSGEVYHVDHIVPLKGENICGLHVPWNLQILPADINLSKGNRYADDA